MLAQAGFGFLLSILWIILISLDKIQIKKYDLSLSARLTRFAEQNAAMKDELMALKWLGNTGSHERKVTRDELLDALQILEHALVELIDNRSTKIQAMAQKLIDKHGKSGKGP
ncbi:MAG: DUF4145 domain-containing protein [Candidatus Methylumidiphilus sp.]